MNRNAFRRTMQDGVSPVAEPLMVFHSDKIRSLAGNLTDTRVRGKTREAARLLEEIDDEMSLQKRAEQIGKLIELLEQLEQVELQNVRIGNNDIPGMAELPLPMPPRLIRAGAGVGPDYDQELEATARHHERFREQKARYDAAANKILTNATEDIKRERSNERENLKLAKAEIDYSPDMFLNTKEGEEASLPFKKKV